MELLNSISTFDCEDDKDYENHSNEMFSIINKITEYKDYQCALLCKYQDKAHKQEKMQIKNCVISKVFEEIECFDMKNGIDMYLDEDGYINFLIYGQGYDFNRTYNLVTVGVKVLPYDESRDFMDISNLIKNNKEPTKSKKQFESKYN